MNAYTLITTVLAWCSENTVLTGAAIAAAGAAQVGRLVLTRHRRQAMARRAALVTITPPSEVDPAGAAVFWTTMAQYWRLTPAVRLPHAEPAVMPRPIELAWSGLSFGAGGAA